MYIATIISESWQYLPKLNVHIPQPSNPPILGICPPQEMHKHFDPRYVYELHRSSIHNSSKLEITQMSINNGTKKSCNIQQWKQHDCLTNTMGSNRHKIHISLRKRQKSSTVLKSGYWSPLRGSDQEWAQIGFWVTGSVLILGLGADHLGVTKQIANEF